MVAVATVAVVAGSARTRVAAEAGAQNSPTVGAIEGHVRLSGLAIASSIIRMGADPYCAKLYAGKRVIQDATVLSSAGGLDNVFVRLTGTFPQTPVPTAPVVIDQQACVYRPRVVGARVGQTLEIRNSDMTLHNIHSVSTKGNEFNVSEPLKGMVQKIKVAHEEVMLHIKCDVHRWMTEYVGVVDHPYFAVTGDGGTFKISAVPAGTQTIETWHEVYGTLTKAIDVKPGATTSVDFTYDRKQAAP
jgi:plastocyanin